MKLPAASLLLVLCVASCAAPPPPPPPAPPPRPTIPQNMIDGLYRGTSTRYQADSRSCPSPGLVALQIDGGQFTYRWSGAVRLPASVLPDGTVQGQLDELTLSGTLTPAQPAANGVRAQPARIVGDVKSPTCAIHFTVTRRGS